MFRSEECLLFIKHVRMNWQCMIYKALKNRGLTFNQNKDVQLHDDIHGLNRKL